MKKLIHQIDTNRNASNKNTAWTCTCLNNKKTLSKGLIVLAVMYKTLIL